MNTSIKQLSLILALFLPFLGHAASWVDSYWPLNSGDEKFFTYAGDNLLTVTVSDNWDGEYRLDFDSPDGSGSEFHSKVAGKVYLNHLKVGWNNVYLSPSVLLFDELTLEQGGSITTQTDVSQPGTDYSASFTVKITPAGTVTVPAGTFANCRNFIVTERATIPGMGTVTVTAMTAVLAPEVGMIKKLVRRGVWAELISGTVGGFDVSTLSSEAPSAVITSPARNARIATSSSTVPVSGVVSGNLSGMQVFYRLNGGGWQAASVSGASWQGEISPQPGNNELQAYARATSGRTSHYASAPFVFVVQAPIQLVVSGQGLVKGVTNGQLLEIDSPVKARATPGRGYRLTGWQADVDGVTVLSTNRATPFTMQSNLVLTATFTDIKKPVLKVLTPKNRRTVGDANLAVSGLVKDNSPDGTVVYQLNDGAWNNAEGWTNWSAQVSLAPGANVLKVQAVDQAGNPSPIRTLNVLY